ncbi:hypothetical protein Bbelb_080250 [Branchiostoma belcheri]|nr:hypothetical protein Bbelb_080250 [Branchiostoma belcheri]
MLKMGKDVCCHAGRVIVANYHELPRARAKPEPQRTNLGPTAIAGPSSSGKKPLIQNPGYTCRHEIFNAAPTMYQGGTVLMYMSAVCWGPSTGHLFRHSLTHHVLMATDSVQGANASSPTDVVAYRRKCQLSMRNTFNQYFSVEMPCSRVLSCCQQMCM